MADLKYRQGSYAEVQLFAAPVLTDLADQISLEELATAYRWSGVAATALGDYDTALDQLQQAEILCHQVQNKDRLSRVWESMAFIYFLQKKLELALTYTQKSLELSREFSTVANVASSLSNIALVQLQLGRPIDALATLNEAITTVRSVSRNYLATFLANKAEILCYLGRFTEAQACFAEANDLFSKMDDDGGVLELSLLQAYEYHCALGEWQAATALLQRAQDLISQRLESDPEARARLLIALSQVALAKEDFLRADQYCQEALALVEEKDIAWWRPAVYYLLGRAEWGLGHDAQAAKTLHLGVTAVAGDGCPDYLPLLYLALAEVEPDRKVEHLQNCVMTANQRARYVDRIYCLDVAGAELLRSQPE